MNGGQMLKPVAFRQISVKDGFESLRENYSDFKPSGRNEKNTQILGWF